MINVYESFLKEEDFLDFQKVSDNFLKSNMKEQLKSSDDTWTNKNWSNNVVMDSSIVYCHRDHEVKKRVKDILNEKYQMLPEYDCYFNFWTSGSHLPWHEDCIYKGAITIFLNEEWDINNGGLFLFSTNYDRSRITDNEIIGVTPKRNRAIKVTNNTLHSVSVLSNNSPVRQTLQIFYR